VYAGKSLSIPVPKTVTVGRGQDVELSFPDEKLSRQHCQFFFKDTACYVKDLSSRNGTYVNGTRIESETLLNDFDRVVIGDVEMEFQNEDKTPHTGDLFLTEDVMGTLGQRAKPGETQFVPRAKHP
jgi:pSer/pThr/pTyr-binding forkhead associated (FHA) protein